MGFGAVNVASSQSSYVQWVFSPAKAPTEWIAGQVISIQYALTFPTSSPLVDAAGTVKIKRNDDQPFQQSGSYFICVGFAGICDAAHSSASLTVPSGTTIASFALSVPATALREGRQLWVQRSFDGTLAAMDAGVKSAVFDIVPTLPAGIEPTVGCRLDIDGDGFIKSETDGLLILRYLLGFRGDPLLSGLVPPSALRRSASSIEAHLAAQDFNLQGIATQGTTDGLI